MSLRVFFYMMTLRVQKYKKNRLMGMNQYNAARAAGYSEKYSRQACRIEKLVQSSIRDVFEQRGLTDKAIVDYALKGMEAMRLQACDVHVQKDEDGKYEINENSNDFIEVPDWQARHKFFYTAMELMGLLKQKVEHSGKIEGMGETKIIVIRQETPKEIVANGNGSHPESASRVIHLNA